MIVKLIAEGPSLIYRTIMATLVEATGSPQVKIAVMGGWVCQCGGTLLQKKLIASLALPRKELLI